MTCVLCQVGSFSVAEGTYFGRTLIPWETASPESWSGQYGSQISQVLRPRRSASARSNHEVRNGHISVAAYAAVNPPRSNPPRRSSSGPPGPWYTPSTLSIIVAVNFMLIAPCESTSIVRLPFGRRLIADAADDATRWASAKTPAGHAFPTGPATITSEVRRCRIL